MPISLKQGRNAEEGLRIAFNARMYSNLCKGANGYKYLEKKLHWEQLFDQWLVNNLDGLPEQKKAEPNNDSAK